MNRFWVQKRFFCAGWQQFGTVYASRHFSTSKFKIMRRLVSCFAALHGETSTYNSELGSSCFAYAKHFGMKNAARQQFDRVDIM